MYSWFASGERSAGVRAFWDVYDANVDRLHALATTVAQKDAQFAKLFANVPAEFMIAQRAQSRERLARAVRGDYEDYERSLREQGSVYAKLGISYSTWCSIVRSVAEALTPLIVAAYHDTPDQLTGALLAMQGFCDWSTSTVGEAFIATKQALVLEREEDLATTLDSIGDGVIATDLHGLVVRMNPVAEQLTGWRLGDARGRSLRDVFNIVNEDTRAVVDSPAERALKEGVVVGLANHTLLIGKDGVERPIADSAAPIRDAKGQTRGVVLVFRDQSEQRDAAMSLHLSREASRMKSEFLANMSHELRTPLNAIIGFTQMLYDDVVLPAMPQFKEFLGDILSSGRHLLRLINDVLDLSKVEAGKLNFYPEVIELAAVIGEVVAILRATAAERRIVVTVEIDAALPAVIVDGSRLKQVLYNYISNALKFTRDDGQGRVWVRVRPDAGGFVLEVEDTGIGISSSDMARLFAEFQQLHSGATKTHSGTGLGLVLTKRLVEAQGGAVGVSSVFGKGSTFWARLPQQTLRPHAPPVVFDKPAVARDGAVLVVDNDPGSLRLMAATLAQLGLRATCVLRAEDALAIAQTELPIAVVLDLMMPEMDGLEFIERFREVPNCRGIPVFVWTMRDLTADETAHLHSVAQAVLQKSREGRTAIVDELRTLFHA